MKLISPGETGKRCEEHCNQNRFFKVCSARLELNNPPTDVGGICEFWSVSSVGWELKDPPTDVGGIYKLWAVSSVGWELKDPPTHVGGIYDPSIVKRSIVKNFLNQSSSLSLLQVVELEAYGGGAG